MKACTRNMLSLLLFGLLSAGCDGQELSNHGQNGDLGPGDEHPNTTEGVIPMTLGQHVFDVETFDGNGRTCLTCHSVETGTLNPRDVQKLFAEDSKGPLFRSIDSDSRIGESYDRLLEHATILAPVGLASNVKLTGDPETRVVPLPRGIPTTMNTPALDSVLMWDGGGQNLEHQAMSAVNGHAEPGRQMTDEEATAVAEFQMTDRRFFSSPMLYDFATGDGAEPELPFGYTGEEIAGRDFFEDDGLCGQCHGGTMLNETTAANTRQTVGTRFANVRVSQFNAMGNDVLSWDFVGDDGSVDTRLSPDPGRALMTGDVSDFESFKIPSLWGIGRTAPYFHDNSAKDLEAVVDHYVQFFASVGRTVSEADRRAILAYLEIL